MPRVALIICSLYCTQKRINFIYIYIRKFQSYIRNGLSGFSVTLFCLHLGIFGCEIDVLYFEAKEPVSFFHLVRRIPGHAG